MLLSVGTSGMGGELSSGLGVVLGLGAGPGFGWLQLVTHGGLPLPAVRWTNQAQE